MARLALVAALVLGGCGPTTSLVSAPGMRRLPSVGTGKPGRVKVATAKPTPPTVSRDLRRPALGNRTLATVTAYCATGRRNAAGNWPTIGTAAGNAWPLGTRLHVATVGDVVIEDRSAPGSTDVDLYLGDGADCEVAAAEFGRRQLEVWQVAA